MLPRSTPPLPPLPSPPSGTDSHLISRLLPPPPGLKNLHTSEGVPPPDSLLSRVITFIRTLPFQSEDLSLPDISPETYQELLSSLEDPKIVGGKVADSIRHSYNPSTGVFKVKCMPTEVHDAALRLCTEMYLDMGMTGFFPRDELKMLALRCGTDNVLPSRRADHPWSAQKRKPSAVKKQADVSFSYGALGGSRRLRAFPSVVFEVGFTESYEDLRGDARQWIVGSRGEVNLVVLFKLTEQRKGTVPPPMAVGEMEEDDNYRDSDSEGEEDGMSELSAGSNPDTYQSLLDLCDPKEWVGPIAGFLEMWRYDKSKGDIHMEGPRVDFFPASGTPAPKVSISKADFKGPHATPADCGEYMELDLNRYRELLVEATMKLAHTRLICHLKAQQSRRRDDGGNYMPRSGSVEVW